MYHPELAAVSAVIVGFAEVIAQSSTSQVTPWVDAGGSAALVAAIIYIAKKVSNGDLVARPVADVARQQEIREEKLAELNRHHAEENQRTIAKLMEVIEDAKSREDALRAMLMQRGQKQ